MKEKEVKCKHKWIPVAQYVSSGDSPNLCYGGIYVVCENCATCKRVA